jgi:flavin reductase (DIM6/NTAB) family NADH-FMN oxidoreductase RutF
MLPKPPDALAQAMSRIPAGLFVLTCAHEHSRSGIIVNWVQCCSTTPPMVVVALQRGLALEPLIRDSRGFALCQISDDDRYLRRKFAELPPGREDPFVSIPIMTTPSGLPIIERAMSYLDCELVRHVDIESDCSLLVGQVRQGAVLHDCRPAVCFSFNGCGEVNGAAPSNGAHINGAGPANGH